MTSDSEASLRHEGSGHTLKLATLTPLIEKAQKELAIIADLEDEMIERLICLRDEINVVLGSRGIAPGPNAESPQPVLKEERDECEFDHLMDVVNDILVDEEDKSSTDQDSTECEDPTAESEDTSSHPLKVKEDQFGLVTTKSSGNDLPVRNREAQPPFQAPETVAHRNGTTHECVHILGQEDHKIEERGTDESLEELTATSTNISSVTSTESKSRRKFRTSKSRKTSPMPIIHRSETDSFLKCTEKEILSHPHHKEMIWAVKEDDGFTHLRMNPWKNWTKYLEHMRAQPDGHNPHPHHHEQRRKYTLKDIEKNTHLLKKYEKAKERGSNLLFHRTLLRQFLEGKISQELPDGIFIAIPPPLGTPQSKWDCIKGRLK